MANSPNSDHGSLSSKRLLKRQNLLPESLSLFNVVWAHNPLLMQAIEDEAGREVLAERLKLATAELEAQQVCKTLSDRLGRLQGLVM
eukprot:332092-Amphidinium_carterae.1